MRHVQPSDDAGAMSSRNEDLRNADRLTAAHRRAMSEPEITITFQSSAVALTCFRCRDLGLPPSGIAPGEQYALVEVVPGPVDTCCADCFQRLIEELREGSSGEEWRA